MKRRVLVLAACIATLTACNKLKDLGQFTFSTPYTAEVDMPVVAGDSLSTLAGDTVINVPLAYATDIDNILSDKNTNAEKLVAVQLSKLSMRIVTPPSQNFDFLDTVRVYLHAPNLPEVLAAKQYAIPTGTKTVTMDTTGVALKPYLLQDSVRIRLNAHIHALPAAGTKLELSSTFRITANPLN